jgi:microcystin-dependent protein
MSVLIFANNAKTTLAGGLTSLSTVLSVVPGAGAEFPSPVAGQHFVVTLTDAATGLINEILWCTSITGDVMTVTRAQEGTAARSWLVGDFVSSFPTAGTQGTFVQPDQFQNGTYEYCIAGGTANALTATLLSALASMPDGMPLVIKALSQNTGASTLTLTLGSTVQPTLSIVKGGNQTLVTGDIPAAGYPMQLNWSSGFNAFVLQNPATGVSVLPVGSIFHFPCTTAPTGFLIAEGQILTRAAYPNLYAFAASSGNIVSDASWSAGNQGSFSSGDGSTTFRLPQYGGYFLRSLDNGNGIDTGRVIGTTQAGQNQIHNHTATSSTTAGSVTTTINDPGHLHSEGVDLTILGKQFLGNGTNEFSGAGSTNLGHGGAPFPTNAAVTGITASTSLGAITTTTTVNNSSGASETRVINISVLTCIKY